MNARDPLERYHSILEGRSLPRFQEAKLDRVGGGPSRLDDKIKEAENLASRCSLCEHRCGAKRGQGKTGRCGVKETRIAVHFPHYGEERPLVPSYTVFFTGCNLRCVFCQNWEISTDGEEGRIVEPGELAKVIEGRGLAAKGSPTCRGVRNVNWVGGEPTPHLPYVLRVLKELNMNIPQVWNSNMYMSTEAMDILEGVIDVYLTDLKFGNDRCAEKLCGAPDYWGPVTRNHIMAHEQGEMIVRHLMLPGHLECCTMPVLEWLSDNVDDVAINLMDQYRPEHNALRHSGLNRGITEGEYKAAVNRARDLGLILI